MYRKFKEFSVNFHDKFNYGFEVKPIYFEHAKKNNFFIIHFTTSLFYVLDEEEQMIERGRKRDRKLIPTQ